MLSVSAVIAVHNQSEVLSTLLATLREQTVPPSEVIVVDDGSDGDEMIEPSSAGEYKLITLPENKGAAFAYNRGIEASTGNTLLILHADVVLPPATIERLLKELYSYEKIGAVSAITNRMRYLSNYVPKVEYQSLDGLIDCAEQIYDDTSREQANIEMILDDYCLMAKREAIQAVEFFDERYSRHLIEGVDMTLSMVAKGYRVLMSMRVYIHHQLSSTDAGAEEWRNFRRETERVFEAKWGFDLYYAQGVRPDLLRFIKSDKPNLSLLEIGCGCGGNLRGIMMAAPKSRRVGIEINPNSAKIAANFADIINMDVESMNPADYPDFLGVFDYIIMGDVIEHLKEPWAALKNLRQFLKPDGELISSIPNVAHISNLLSVLSGNWTYEASGLLDRTHLRFFTKNEILKLFINCGFDISFMGAVVLASSPAFDLLKSELLALNSVKVSSENLDAYQWITVAKNKASV